MTKAELIEAIANKAGTTKQDAERTVDAFFDIVVSSAKSGEKVSWPGFGSFSTTTRAARTGRNPQTGATRRGPRIDGDEVQCELGAQGRAEPDEKLIPQP